MFKIESYVTPILLSYVDKYVRDFKPGDAQVSLWGGGVALHNLVLKTEVLQQEVSLPFTLVSGRIHELLIQVPWTKIMSEPIVVTIDTIECVLNQHRPVDSPPPEPPSHKTQVVEAPPGYMQALVRRIVSNIALRVHHLIVKYVQDDIVMSLNVKHLAVDSAGANWEPTFADIDQNQPLIRRLVRLDDFTLCLDKADADGKIRFYQEPLLYRCRLDLRVLTYLVSANTRRASSIAVQLCSSKLAWSVTSDQLTLLLRLVKERAAADAKPQPTAHKQPATQPPSQTSTKAHSTAEPARSGSWSDWAWSWLPSMSDKEGGVEDVPATPTPVPLNFDAYLDDVSLVYKVIELESYTRKRFRSVLEMSASFAAVKSAACLPTSMRLQFGARNIELRPLGKCVCGFNTYEASGGKPMIYLKRILDSESSSEDWQWPEESLQFGATYGKVEVAEAAEEEPRVPSDEGFPEVGVEQEQAQQQTQPQPTAQTHFQLDDSMEDFMELRDNTDELWGQMSPVLLIRFSHVRSPPDPATNPYDNPPKDFQYSDWVEECRVKVKIQPVEFRVTVGLIHRLLTLKHIFNEISLVPTTEQLMRVLTIEECDALNENMPERRISVEAQGLQVQLLPWDHMLIERPAQVSLILAFEMPNIQMSITGPLYPHRVCAAVCQMPQYSGPLWQACRLTVSVSLRQAQLRVAATSDDKQKPCARTDLRLVVHLLLHQSYFSKMECELFSYSAKINEMNVCGSAARLQAAWQVMHSMMKEHLSFALRNSSLPNDALNDEEAVAVDFTLEELLFRCYRTRNLTTYITIFNSAKATAFHEPLPGKVKQAWIFSAPDVTTAKPYLRGCLQWCDQPSTEALEYVGVWLEPTAISVDPLLIAWLAYKPVLVTKSFEATPAATTTVGKNAPYMLRKRTPSSSGRGGSRSGGSAELVHMRTRASTVSSEPSDKRITKGTQSVEELWWQGERLVMLYQRLRSMLINVEVGLVQVYVTMSTASALGCATLRGAMERHAVAAHRVVAFSLGRLTITSDAAMGHLWGEVQNDAPTFLQNHSELESFPWKLCLADVSCYTLEPQLERVSSDASMLRRSSLKEQPAYAFPRTVLELVTTTLTVSVVTKALQFKNINIVPQPKKEQTNTAPTLTEYRTRYFTSGKAFRPTTLQEFFRGPRRSTKRETKEQQKQEEEAKNEHPAQSAPTEEVVITPGPVVSLGVHLHADTPPIIIKLDQDQLPSPATSPLSCKLTFAINVPSLSEHLNPDE